MKNVLVLFSIMAFGYVASATSIDRTQVLATVSGSEQGIKQIALLADGRLQVVPEEGKVKQIKLTKAASEELFKLVQVLSNVELTDVVYPVVCMMMPPSELSDLQISSYSYETSTYGNKLSLVLTAQNCAVSHRVSPVEVNPLINANELRKALVVLAMNTVVDIKKQ